MDDVNYLLHRRKVSLTLAARASCEESRRVHLELADRYDALIHDHRDRKPERPAFFTSI